MKVCIVCIAKNENKYINEWIDHHLNIGIDHIYVCDNNDPKKESIKDVVSNKKVTILNYKGIKGVQSKAYTKCFLLYRKYYDWMIFIDIDEFIMLDNKYNNIKEFLGEPFFINADIIRLCWKLYSGGSQLSIKNKNYKVVERFTNHIPHKENCFGKSIIRTSIQYTGGKIHGHGYFNNKTLKAVDAVGKPALNEWSVMCDNPIYINAWINHYPTKTIEEFINQKFFRGGPNNNDYRYSTLNYFFKYNEKTDDVVNYIKNNTKLLI